MHIEDKELEKRIKDLEKRCGCYDEGFVYEVIERKYCYLLKINFYIKTSGKHEKRILKLERGYLSKTNKLTNRLYKIFDIDERLDKRNIRLFLVLKYIGVVNKENKIDISKFKGLDFESHSLNHIISKNPKVLHFNYFRNTHKVEDVKVNDDKGFNWLHPHPLSVEEFKFYPGYEKDYKEFKKRETKFVLGKEMSFDEMQIKIEKLKSINRRVSRRIKELEINIKR